MTRKPQEISTENYLTRKVKELGGKSFKLTRYKGIPDRMILLNGGVYFLELKKGASKLSSAQELRREWFVEKGFFHAVIRNREDVKRFLEVL